MTTDAAVFMPLVTEAKTAAAVATSFNERLRALVQSFVADIKMQCCETFHAIDVNDVRAFTPEDHSYDINLPLGEAVLLVRLSAETERLLKNRSARLYVEMDTARLLEVIGCPLNFIMVFSCLGCVEYFAFFPKVVGDGVYTMFDCRNAACSSRSLGHLLRDVAERERNELVVAGTASVSSDEYEDEEEESFSVSVEASSSE
jgi:HPt (histidine-containing phosphotransfer) domain-containing protein